MEIYCLIRQIQLRVGGFQKYRLHSGIFTEEHVTDIIPDHDGLFQIDRREIPRSRVCSATLDAVLRMQ